jgi:hypothetical protein
MLMHNINIFIEHAENQSKRQLKRLSKQAKCNFHTFANNICHLLIKRHYSHQFDVQDVRYFHFE